MKRELLALLLVTWTLSGCTTAITPIMANENITSTPSDAEIHWGETKGKIKATDLRTPFSRALQAQASGWESWCYRVTKEGYKDSGIVCRPVEQGHRNIHFDLKKIEIEDQKTVLVTGAASSLRKITTSDTAEINPSLSPDKSWLLVEVYEVGDAASHKSVLQKINLTNLSKVILTQKSDNSRDGDWYPDGKAIIYASDKLGALTLVESMGISGESAVRFVTPPSFTPATQPDVSPDGRQVAFSLFSSRNDNQICVIDKDGTNLRVFGNGYGPRWSPSGKQILFTRTVGSASRLYTMDADTGGNLKELSSSEGNDRGATWSPDGKHMAFISDRARDRSHLFIMDINGQGIIQLTDGRFDINSADWGEDGYLYFSSNAGGNWDIWRLEPKY